MHENKFEKEVRDKMDQLLFDPTDAIWTGVDKEINKEKKRRRVLFWFFFLIGIAVLSGLYYFSGSDPGNPGEPKAGYESFHPPAALEKMSQHRSQKKNDKFKKSVKVSVNAVIVNDINQNGQDRDLDEINIQKTKEETPAWEQKLSDSSAGIKSNSDVANKNAVLIETVAVDSVVEKSSAKKQDQKSKSSSWKIGFTGSAGISNMNQNLFLPSNGTNPAYYSTAPPPGTGTGGVYYSPSEISSGFSYSLGVFVNRYLSKRVSFSTGISYHYYSTSMQTGALSDTAVLLNTANGRFSSSGQIYRYGKTNTYTNHFHFLELPLTFSFQLNKSSRIPVYWEQNLAFSYLLSSNALQFDPANNVYYEDNLLLNKMQFSTATSLLIGFPLNKNEVRVGPQFQYGLTGLVNTSTGNEGHLSYFGVKISFLLRNK